MFLKAVCYDGDIEAKVNEFNNLKHEDKKGEYWDSSDDKRLVLVKKYIKDHYIKVQDYTCPYCKQRVEVDHNAIWDLDHIIAKDKSPQFLFEPENLCVSCKDCNVAKRNKNVLLNKKRKTFTKKSDDYIFIHPHFDDYYKHMKVLKNSLFFIPKDEKGRNTIEICGLLRFLYKFSEYGDVPLEIKIKIGSFHQQLMESSSALEDNHILSCIGDLVEHGKQLSKKNILGVDNIAI
ncbi:HNH endonuclease [Aliivibrio fischeri]|uniref:HNH endonuclease n=1 Tax=Aliivibrio fischeri TaxID=668 RepID=UPI0012DA2018|nr:HNH endonuclease [Aliivibrio fischeri]MUJ39724.1 HNH endonuclease [Aliivibrio fischeri]